jgi:hypothetical protein
MILFEKYGQHQSLNRQAERYAREGVPLSLSTLADPRWAHAAPRWRRCCIGSKRAYGGYNKLYEAQRQPRPIVEAACWVHARRPFFVLADLAANPAGRRKAKPRA